MQLDLQIASRVLDDLQLLAAVDKSHLMCATNKENCYVLPLREQVSVASRARRALQPCNTVENISCSSMISPKADSGVLKDRINVHLQHRRNGDPIAESQFLSSRGGIHGMPASQPHDLPSPLSSTGLSSDELRSYFDRSEGGTRLLSVEGVLSRPPEAGSFHTDSVDRGKGIKRSFVKDCHIDGKVVSKRAHSLGAVAPRLLSLIPPAAIIKCQVLDSSGAGASSVVLQPQVDKQSAKRRKVWTTNMKYCARPFVLFRCLPTNSDSVDAQQKGSYNASGRAVCSSGFGDAHVILNVAADNSPKICTSYSHFCVDVAASQDYRSGFVRVAHNVQSEEGFFQVSVPDIMARPYIRIIVSPNSACQRPILRVDLLAVVLGDTCFGQTYMKHLSYVCPCRTVACRPMDQRASHNDPVLCGNSLCTGEDYSTYGMREGQPVPDGLLISNDDVSPRFHLASVNDASLASVNGNPSESPYLVNMLDSVPPKLSGSRTVEHNVESVCNPDANPPGDICATSQLNTSCLQGSADFCCTSSDAQDNTSSGQSHSVRNVHKELSSACGEAVNKQEDEDNGACAGMVPLHSPPMSTISCRSGNVEPSMHKSCGVSQPHGELTSGIGSADGTSACGVVAGAGASGRALETCSSWTLRGSLQFCMSKVSLFSASVARLDPLELRAALITPYSFHILMVTDNADSGTPLAECAAPRKAKRQFTSRPDEPHHTSLQVVFSLLEEYACRSGLHMEMIAWVPGGFCCTVSPLTETLSVDRKSTKWLLVLVQLAENEVADVLQEAFRVHHGASTNQSTVGEDISCHHTIPFSSGRSSLRVLLDFVGIFSSMSHILHQWVQDHAVQYFCRGNEYPFCSLLPRVRADGDATSENHRRMDWRGFALEGRRVRVQLPQLNVSEGVGRISLLSLRLQVHVPTIYVCGTGACSPRVVLADLHIFDALDYLDGAFIFEKMRSLSSAPQSTGNSVEFNPKVIVISDGPWRQLEVAIQAPVNTYSVEHIRTLRRQVTTRWVLEAMSTSFLQEWPVIGLCMPLLSLQNTLFHRIIDEVALVDTILHWAYPFPRCIVLFYCGIGRSRSHSSSCGRGSVQSQSELPLSVQVMQGFTRVTSLADAVK